MIAELLKKIEKIKPQLAELRATSDSEEIQQLTWDLEFAEEFTESAVCCETCEHKETSKCTCTGDETWLGYKPTKTAELSQVKEVMAIKQRVYCNLLDYIQLASLIN